MREAFLEYESMNGPLLRKLLKIVGIEYDGSEEARRRLLSTLRMVAFTPEK
jgi:hypothetical protein